VNQLAVDLGADRHLDQIVIHIADDARRRTENYAFVGENVALDDALDGCGRILNDEFSDKPEKALYMIGNIEEAGHDKS